MGRWGRWDYCTTLPVWHEPGPTMTKQFSGWVSGVPHIWSELELHSAALRSEDGAGLFSKWTGEMSEPGRRGMRESGLSFEGTIPIGTRRTCSSIGSGQWTTSSCRQTSVLYVPLLWPITRSRWRCPLMSQPWASANLRSRQDTQVTVSHTLPCNSQLHIQ